MKLLLLILFINLTLFFGAKAQTPETISQLTPIASNTDKFSKRLPINKSRIINKDNLKFVVSTEPVNLSDNKKGITIIIKTFYKEITFDTSSGKPTARLKFYGRVTSKDKTTDGFFEERLSESTYVENLVKAINKEIVLRKVFELSEGNYQIGVIVTDIISGIRGVKIFKFSVRQSINTQTNNSSKND